MNKITAILLLGIFAFNLFGYKLYTSFMENEASKSLESALDKNNYNEAELISIKKPINLPYYNNTKEFSRIDGEVEIDGVFYKYVKCRIYNDCVEMLCLPNTQKTKIKKSGDDYFKIIADIQKNTNEKNKSNSGNTFKKVLSEFEEISSCKLLTQLTSLKKNGALSHYTSSLGLLHKATVEQPPDYLFSV